MTWPPHRSPRWGLGRCTHLTSAMADEIVYAATGHPQDPLQRRSTLHTLRLSADGATLTALQSINLPERSAMPMYQAMPTACNTLYTVAGPLGVLAYKIDPQTGMLLPPSAYSHVIEPAGAYATDVPVEVATAAGPPAAGPRQMLTSPIEGQPTDSVPGGAGACHITMDAKDDAVLCANYEAGSVAWIPVADMRSGELGPPVSSRHVRPPHTTQTTTLIDRDFSARLPVITGARSGGRSGQLAAGPLPSARCLY